MFLVSSGEVFSMADILGTNIAVLSASLSHFGGPNTDHQLI